LGRWSGEKNGEEWNGFEGEGDVSVRKRCGRRGEE
jgi:hypothetical protein